MCLAVSFTPHVLHNVLFQQFKHLVENIQVNGYPIQEYGLKSNNILEILEIVQPFLTYTKTKTTISFAYQTNCLKPSRAYQTQIRLLRIFKTNNKNQNLMFHMLLRIMKNINI